MTSENLDRAIVTISKEALAALPPAEYEGKIRIIDRPGQVAEAIKELRKTDLIGFDTETRPSFRKGQSYKVALIQLSSPDSSYLFRTNIIGYPEAVFKLLEDPSITKVGVSVHDDFHNLNKIKPFNPQSFIDLQTYVKDFRIADNSLSRLYGILFGKRICKSQRLTNWEAEELTDAQAAYAALDAHSCVEIYNYLRQGKFNPLSSPYLIIPPLPEEEEIANEKNEN